MPAVDVAAAGRRLAASRAIQSQALALTFCSWPSLLGRAAEAWAAPGRLTLGAWAGRQAQLTNEPKLSWRHADVGLGVEWVAGLFISMGFKRSSLRAPGKHWAASDSTTIAKSPMHGRI